VIHARQSSLQGARLHKCAALPPDHLRSEILFSRTCTIPNLLLYMYRIALRNERISKNSYQRILQLFLVGLSKGWFELRSVKRNIKFICQHFILTYAALWGIPDRCAIISRVKMCIILTCAKLVTVSFPLSPTRGRCLHFKTHFPFQAHRYGRNPTRRGGKRQIFAQVVSGEGDLKLCGFRGYVISGYACCCRDVSAHT